MNSGKAGAAPAPTSSEPSFAGVRPVLHLPITSRGAIDWDALQALAARMLELGVDGLVVLGLATEVWTMSEPERAQAVTLAAEVVAGRVPLVAGLDGDVEAAAREGEQLAALGADALMVRPPADVDSPVEHYGALASRLSLPILIQDAPAGTGVDLGVDDILELARRHPNLRSVKVERPAGGPRVSALVEAGVEVVAGWAGLHYLESVERGATGLIPGCDLGPAFMAIDRHARAGDLEAAARLYDQVLPLLAYEAQSLELMIAGEKRTLWRQGLFPTPALRDGAPIDRFQEATLERLIAGLESEHVPGFDRVETKGTQE